MACLCLDSIIPRRSSDRAIKPLAGEHPGPPNTEYTERTRRGRIAQARLARSRQFAPLNAQGPRNTVNEPWNCRVQARLPSPRRPSGFRPRPVQPRNLVEHTEMLRTILDQTQPGTFGMRQLERMDSTVYYVEEPPGRASSEAFAATRQNPKGRKRRGGLAQTCLPARSTAAISMREAHLPCRRAPCFP